MIVDVNKIKKSVGIIGESVEIEEMCTLIGQVANTDISILITGILFCFISFYFENILVVKSIQKRFDIERKLPNNNFLIKNVIEKPSIKKAPSNKCPLSIAVSSSVNLIFPCPVIYK